MKHLSHSHVSLLQGFFPTPPKKTSRWSGGISMERTGEVWQVKTLVPGWYQKKIADSW